MTEISGVISKDLSFEAAEEYFKGKIPVSKSEFYKLVDEYKTKAFIVSGYNNSEIIKKFMNELQNAIDNGTTLKDFQKNMNSFLENKGYEGITPYQADNIFRTNIQTAYSVGHYTAMTDPEVKRLRPYWEYDAVNDGKTRPSHRAMDGLVYPADHSFWDTYYPPNGFRCRCGVTTLSKRQVEQRGLSVMEEIPDRGVDKETGELFRIHPDKNFGYNPAKKAFEADLKGYPEALKKAYENHLNKR